MENKKIKSGFVTLLGRTNVGKSTLMNRLVGEKLSIVSNRPQTTRNKIRTVLNTEDAQIVFVDTPGIHKPKNKLSEKMVKSAKTMMNDVDVVLFLVEPDKEVGPGDQYLMKKLKTVESPVFLVINKIDTLENKDDLLVVIEKFSEYCDFDEIIPVSALNGFNADVLVEEIIKRLDEGPRYFPEDMITDQPEKQLISELIREQALKLLKEEVPHGVAVVIEKMEQRGNRNLIDISATIYTEKKTHKGIIIGKNGKMLKEIGTKAREAIEKRLGSKVYLELWVKIKKDWRDKDILLDNFGYDDEKM